MQSLPRFNLAKIGRHKVQWKVPFFSPFLFCLNNIKCELMPISCAIAMGEDKKKKKYIRQHACTHIGDTPHTHGCGHKHNKRKGRVMTRRLVKLLPSFSTFG